MQKIFRWFLEKTGIGKMPNPHHGTGEEAVIRLGDHALTVDDHQPLAVTMAGGHS